MAEQTVKLKLDTRQFDQGMQRVKGGFGGLATAIAATAAAFGGLQVAKGFLTTARSIENLKFQLAALTGSTTEAAKAMEILQTFAGGVPFELGEIQKAAPSLLAVADSTEELNELLAITGDIAAASGLDFQTVALQLQRTFSAGIGAADLFRDRAVKSMLGFQEGVQYTAAQSRDLIINGFRDQTIAIAGESAKMASTFDGVVSMMNDKYLQFQIAVMDSGPFENLKAAMTLVEQELSKNFGNIKDKGAEIGDTLVEVTKKALIGGAKIMDALTPVFEVVKRGINGLIKFVNQLPPEFQILGLIGFFLVGRGIKILLVTVAAFFDKIKGFMDDMVIFFSDKINGMIRVANMIPGVEMKEFTIGMKPFSSYLEEVNKNFVDFVDGATSDVKEITFDLLGLDQEDMGKHEKNITKIIKALEKQVAMTKALEEAERALDEGNGGKSTKPPVEEKLSKEAVALKKQFDQLNASLMSETEREIQEHQKKLSILDKYYVDKNKKDGEYQRISETLAIKHANKLAAIAKTNFDKQLNLFKDGEFAQMDFSKFSADQKKDFAIGAGKEVLNALAQQNKAAFQAAKALAITEAIINTAQGATKALAQGGIFGPILAGLVIAAGAAQIATINAQQYQGRKTGGLVQKGTPYVVGEGGSEMFVPNQTGTIIPNGNMGGNKPVSVTFNINAIDAKGVDELLVERKGLITGIIRDAANQKGERSPV